MNDSEDVVGLVLAAGASSRLGQPKQLVEYQGQPLVACVSQKLLSAGCSSVVTVLGANANRISSAIGHLPITVIVNNDWRNGIGNSISFAMQHIAESAKAVVISVCDQPMIETRHYQLLIQHVLSGGNSIAATEYSSNKSGVPAAFARKHFCELGRLEGDIGARRIIQANRHVALKVLGQILDIDTPQDLKTLAEYR